MQKFEEITFSQEELIYLLRALNLPDLAGMGDRPWGHIPKESAPLVMETVGRGLVARQAARFGSVRMEIDPEIAKLLSACAYPRQMTVLIYEQDKTTVQRIYFRGEDFDVEHSLPHPWVHRFSVKSKSDLGLMLLQSLVKDAPRGKNGDVFTIQQGKLDEIRQLSASDTDSASKQLMDAGFPLTPAKNFASVLQTPKIKILIQTVYDLGKTIRQNVFSILANDAHCWLTLAEQANTQTVQAMQVDRKKLNQVIIASFQPLN